MSGENRRAQPDANNNQPPSVALDDGTASEISALVDDKLQAALANFKLDDRNEIKEKEAPAGFVSITEGIEPADPPAADTPGNDNDGTDDGEEQDQTDHTAAPDHTAGVYKEEEEIEDSEDEAQESAPEESDQAFIDW